jgi:hypothetical protein
VTALTAYAGGPVPWRWFAVSLCSSADPDLKSSDFLKIVNRGISAVQRYQS